MMAPAGTVTFNGCLEDELRVSGLLPLTFLTQCSGRCCSQLYTALQLECYLLPCTTHPCGWPWLRSCALGSLALEVSMRREWAKRSRVDSGLLESAV